MENLKSIINQVKLNGGATLKADYSNANLKSGYVASIFGYEKTYNMDALNMEQLSADMQAYSKYVSEHQNAYIGLWIDNGMLYLDISKHIAKKQNAIEFGKRNNQLSVYDVINDAYIDLRIDTYIIYEFDAKSSDYKYVYETTNKEDIKRDFNVKRICDYVIKSIDEPIKHLLNDKYIIINEKVLESEVF